MQRLPCREVGGFIVILLLLVLPALLQAQSGQAGPGAPPVGQPVVSEGAFAVNLASALAVTSTEDEVEAESLLGDAGIAPRNGWIADYPVTPDIVMEVRSAVADAAAAGNITPGKDEALKALDDVLVGLGLSVKSYAAGQNYEPSPRSCETYPNPAAINDSYSNEGPPVVTYYCPPPAYYNLYAWVPCPFWWTDLWFPGFFILQDFHRVTHFHGKVVVISNHFNDVKTHRVFRIDPIARFNGRTFAGIGVPRPKDFISTGVPKSAQTIFNGPRAQKIPGRVSVSPPSGSRPHSPPSGGRSATPPSGGGRSSGPSSGGGGMRR